MGGIALNLHIRPLENLPQDYDLLVGAVGFETRSTYIAEHVSACRRVLFQYAAVAGGATAENVARARSLPETLVRPSDGLEEFEKFVTGVFGSVRDGSRIAVDVSSLDRRRLAILLAVLHLRSKSTSDVTADILYAPARFAPPPAALARSPLQAGPIGTGFQGHLRRTTLPLAAVFGLGYEPHRAIGAFELLEPGSAWAFWPVSSDELYVGELESANRLLVSMFSTSNVIDYPVLDPGETYYRLESLVAGLREQNRVVLVPMGPKIFATCCILLGLGSDKSRPAVWRVGVSDETPQADSVASGEIVGLQWRLNPGMETI
jgi:hypothetical protein